MSPSSEVQGRKAFEGQEGSKSQDLDAVREATPVEEKAAEATPEGEKAQPAAVEKKEADESYIRLKQEIARLQGQLAKAGPYAQLGQAVVTDPAGKKAVERWQRGGKLFEEAIMGDTSEEHPSEQPKPVSREEMNELMDQRDAARTQMDTLKSLGREHFEHYDKVAKSDQYVRYLSNNLDAVWNDAIPLDPDVLDWPDAQLARNFTAMKEAYRQYMASNPKVIAAAKKAGKAEEKERAEAALSAESASSGGTSSSEKEPPEKTETDDMIDRMVNARGRGVSFNTVARKK